MANDEDDDDAYNSSDVDFGPTPNDNNRGWYALEKALMYAAEDRLLVPHRTRSQHPMLREVHTTERKHDKQGNLTEEMFINEKLFLPPKSFT